MSARAIHITATATDTGLTPITAITAIARMAITATAAMAGMAPATAIGDAAPTADGTELASALAVVGPVS